MKKDVEWYEVDWQRLAENPTVANLVGFRKESEEKEVTALESIREEIWEEMLRLEDKRKERWADIRYITLREVLQKLGHLDEPGVNSQTDKLETLVVPEELGTWLGNKELGDRSCYFTVINELGKYWCTVLEPPLSEFIAENKKELIEVILGSREYKVEEPKYYALVKGHELIKNKGIWTTKYWNLDTTDGNKLLSNRFTVDGKYLIKMSKEEWHKIGINDSNADFIKV